MALAVNPARSVILQKQFGDLKCNARVLSIAPAANSEHLFFHFPNMGFSPLHHICGGLKGIAERIEIFLIHLKTARR